MSASSFLPAWAGKGTWTEYALIDMNADGLPDLVQGKGVDAGAGGFRVWYNNKTGFDVEPVDIWAQYGMISLTINHSSQQNVLIESRTVLNLIDFNGDGLPDQVAARGANAPYGYWDVYPNVGHAMAQRFPVAVFGALSLTTYNQNEKRVVRDLLDVDGDGLPDLIDVTASDTWQVHRNRGAAFAPEFKYLGANGFIHVERTVSSSQKWARSRLADIDGDGLVDRVEAIANGSNQLMRISEQRDHSFRSSVISHFGDCDQRFRTT